MKHVFKLFIILFFLFSLAFTYANPFTGNRNSPNPPRQSKPNEKIIKSQIIVHTKLGDYIAEWKDNKSGHTLLIILSLSFLYGIIHAAGPGHRKTVVFSFYLSRKSRAAEPFLISAALAAAHGGAAVFIALFFKGVSGALSVNSNNTSIYLEIISFFILILLSLYSIIHCITDFYRERFISAKNKTCENTHKKLKLTALLISGLYPCPAALLILVLTITLNITFLGILAVIALSAGMSLPITAAAYLAWGGRKSLFFKLQNSKRIMLIISSILEIGAYSFLLFFSVYSILPFLSGLLKAH